MTPSKSPSHKTIITCAITGSIHTPTMSPYLPITPDQIVSEAIAAADAGAAILHLHARAPQDGRPSADPDVFMQFLPRIKQATDAVVNITTGGSSVMTLDERLAAPIRAEPEMCSLNMGSMNFGLFPALDKPRDWQHAWEPELLESTRSTIFKNTFADIEHILLRLGEFGTRFEFECYDVGHLYSLAHFRDRGLLPEHLFIQFVFGALGGIGAAPDNLVHMKQVADRLFGADYSFSVLGAGRHQMPMITMAAAMGGHVRVGLEDSLYNGRGVLARSNAEQVLRIRTVLDALSLEVASPSEARDMLGLKGADKVAF
jgi:uncharacterized protein (DUF849 family)